MKILTSSQVMKMTLLTSESGGVPMEGDSAPLRLSPPLDWSDKSCPAGVFPVPSSQGEDALDKQIKIATKKLQLGCTLRQEDSHHASHKDSLGSVSHLQEPLTDGINATECQKSDLFNRWCSESTLPHLPFSNLHGEMAPGTQEVPFSLLQEEGSPPVQQIREYRKSLSVRLGSLKWSLDLVMVVKSRSSSKSTVPGRSKHFMELVGRPSSRACKAHGRSERRRNLRTQSCISLLQPCDFENE